MTARTRLESSNGGPLRTTRSASLPRPGCRRGRPGGGTRRDRGQAGQGVRGPEPEPDGVADGPGQGGRRRCRPRTGSRTARPGWPAICGEVDRLAVDRADQLGPDGDGDILLGQQVGVAEGVARRRAGRCRARTRRGRASGRLDRVEPVDVDQRRDLAGEQGPVGLQGSTSGLRRGLGLLGELRLLGPGSFSCRPRWLRFSPSSSRRRWLRPPRRRLGSSAVGLGFVLWESGSFLSSSLGLVLAGLRRLGSGFFWLLGLLASAACFSASGLALASSYSFFFASYSARSASYLVQESA